MSFQLPTQQEKALYVLNQFDRIAERYDLTNDVISLGMHRLWKRRALRELVFDPAGMYLDVCCGTGDLALMLAGRLKPGGNVTGLDFSEKMLAIAAARHAKAEASSRSLFAVEWVRGDAQCLPFKDGQFDGAIVSFGLRNLTDLQRGLNEMARVVKTGGRVVNLDLGRVRLPWFAPLFDLYFQRVVPLLGELLQKDRQAYSYLPASLATYPSPDRITAMFQAASLANVHHYELALGSVALHVGTVP